ncbi:MAG: LolA-like protein [Streptosporangiaceae bacterium]
MTALSMRQERRRSRSPRHVITAGIGAAVLVAAAGCSASSQSGGAQAGGSGSGKPAAASTAGQALALAASTSTHVDSLSVRLSVTQGASTFSGTMDMRLKPTTAIVARFSAAGQQIREILAGGRIYLSISQLRKLTGKPWLEASMSSLAKKAGLNLTAILQNVENSDPLAQARLFAVAKNVHKVGPATVNGVATTEYAGTYQPQAILKRLPSSALSKLGPMLRKLGTHPVSFHVWIDGQHDIRKTTTTEVIGGQTVITSYNVMSINQPVTVSLPPASEVAPLSSLGGLG